MIEFLLYLALALPLCAAERHHDIVVYGSTSGDIIAAIQATKSERSVVLVLPTPYLGGLTTSALGWTDLVSDAILSGLSRDFYTRIYQHFQEAKASNWEERLKFTNKGQSPPALNPKTQLASVFELFVATAVFKDMLKEYGFTVVTARLDLKNGVIMDGKRIQKIRTEDDREFAGKMFVDATYEGGLLTCAGVSFTVGDGDDQGDNRLQAYCFRRCFADVPANQVTITSLCFSLPPVQPPALSTTITPKANSQQS